MLKSKLMLQSTVVVYSIGFGIHKLSARNFCLEGEFMFASVRVTHDERMLASVKGNEHVVKKVSAQLMPPGDGEKLLGNGGEAQQHGQR